MSQGVIDTSAKCQKTNINHWWRKISKVNYITLFRGVSYDNEQLVSTVYSLNPNKKNNTKGVDKLVAGGGYWCHVLHGYKT